MSIRFQLFALLLGFAKAQSLQSLWTSTSYSSSKANTNKFQPVHDKAHLYKAFHIDARQFKHDAHIGFSKSNSTISGDIEIQVIMGGWRGSRCVIYHGKYLVKTTETSISQWIKIRSDFTISLVDGKIAVMQNSKLFMSYENPSIKKNEFKFLMVSASWGSSGQWKIQGTPQIPNKGNRLIFYLPENS